MLEQLISLTVLCFLFSLLLTHVFSSRVRSRRLIGVDVHKPHRPLVPKIGGVSMLISYSVCVLTLFVWGDGSQRLWILLFSPLIAALIGLIEDVREINPILKPVLLLTPALPTLLFSDYSPYPQLPLVGTVRLTIIYPVLILAAFTVIINAINSVDVLNGSLALSSMPVLVVLTVLSWMRGEALNAIAASTAAASVLGFLRFNWYPARIFAGNCGSNFVGALITSIAITSRLELATLVALLPHILNEYFILVSIGGLRSGKTFTTRPITVVRGLIAASRDPRGPLTLVRLATSSSPMNEAEVSKALGLLAAYSSFLAFVTYLLGGGRSI
jgi:UDP-N-acetylglucosamine--dolichyl-phosphate N-acetylglucosaminephosphotransferase